MRLGTLLCVGLVVCAVALPATAEEGHITFKVPGQYEARGQAMSRIPLYDAIEGVPADLGQRAFGYHWFRATPVLNFTERLVLTGQIDLLRGVMAGDTAEEVVDDSGRDELDGYSSIDPRWLFLELRSAAGQIRAGQMGSSWGLGLMANDGLQEQFFGDSLYGDITERILVSSNPIPIVPLEAGLVLAAGGDVVYWDGVADVWKGDLAMQGVVAAVLVREATQLGAYGVYRDQTNDLGDTLRVVAADIFMRHSYPLPGGSESSRAMLAFEGVLVSGSSTMLRTLYEPEQDVLQGGLLVQLGATTRKLDANLELGWASGDANPYDDTVSRFTFDPDHNVGLVLFEEVMAWQTARAASLAANPEIAGRPARGIGLLPTRGGVSGAMYVNPTVRYRLLSSLDISAGVLFAQTTADVVDPFRQKVSGAPQNYRGGRAESRDLGVELDAGVRFNRRVGYVALEAGIEGGVLLPGHAFDDADGQRMKPLGVGRLRLGLTW